MGSCAPVLFLMWNRPGCVTESFAQVRAAKPQELFIASDGPIPDNSSNQLLVQECRKLVESMIDWKCVVRYRYLSENQGCRKAVSGAISWFFESVSAGIIIEDDIVCDISFFWYASNMLERYRDELNVGMISANCFNKEFLEKGDYDKFTIHPHIWGWATWRRVWNDYNESLEDYSQLGDFLRLWRRGGLLFASFWSSVFAKVQRGDIDTWDYQFSYLFYTRKYYSLTPGVEAASNIGFSADASHTNTGKSPLDMRETCQIQKRGNLKIRSSKRHDRRTFISNYVPTRLRRIPFLEAMTYL